MKTLYLRYFAVIAMGACISFTYASGNDIINKTGLDTGTVAINPVSDARDAVEGLCMYCYAVSAPIRFWGIIPMTAKSPPIWERCLSDIRRSYPQFNLVHTPVSGATILYLGRDCVFTTAVVAEQGVIEEMRKERNGLFQDIWDHEDLRDVIKYYPPLDLVFIGIRPGDRCEVALLRLDFAEQGGHVGHTAWALWNRSGPSLTLVRFYTRDIYKLRDR